MRTGKWRERSVAWVAVMLWHALAGWWLLRTMHIGDARADDEALQIVFVDRPTEPAPAAAPAVRHLSRTPRIRAPATNERVVTTSPSLDTSPPAATRSLSAVFLDQAHLATEHQPGTFVRRPWDKVPVRLPGEDSQRFRMRSQITPQSAVVWVSKHLFYPPGYAADPCPHNKENIGNLMANGDSAAMQQEVEFERAHCRP
jgi:hypothetical protein